MSIQVRTSEAFQESQKLEAAKEAPQTSAPEVQDASEQNESEDSDTTETEDKEESTDEVKDDSEESESSDEDKSEESEKDKQPKKKGGFQRRIDKLNARQSATAQELEYWKQLALKQGAGEPKAQSKVEQSSQPAASEGKPNPDHFDTHAAYVEAVAEWTAEKKLNERARKDEQGSLIKAHQERVKSFAEKMQDFQEVLAEVDHIPVSPTVGEIIISSDNGPALMYELAKNPEEYARICKLSPLAAAREIGKIESRLSQTSSEAKIETKKITKAPKPIGPLGASGKAGVAKSISDPSLSQADYERMRREQMKRRKA